MVNSVTMIVLYVTASVCRINSANIVHYSYMKEMIGNIFDEHNNDVGHLWSK